MGDTEDLYFLRFEHRPLTPEQWNLLKRSAVRRARESRAQMVRSLFGALLTSIRTAARSGRALGSRAVAAARRSWRSYATWRERRRAVKELGGLEDRMLKDMGLHRSEIESVIYGSDASRRPDAAVAAFPCRNTQQARKSGAAKGKALLIEKSAA
jgi:uncharacterized protein YjiS (DUF1127 family)